MEANEIMQNEEVMETATEEIVKAGSVSGFKNAAVFGLVFIAGYVAGKYIIDPAIARFKARKQTKQEIITEEPPIEIEFEEKIESDETEKESE